nr:cytochrome P450 [Halalkalicoccus subterraneus]
MVDELAAEWREAGGPDTRNLHEEMTAMTLRVASEILLGEDLGRKRAEQFHEWMHIAGIEFEFSPSTVRPNWLPQRISPEFKQAAEGIRTLSEEIIEQRRAKLAAVDEDQPPRDMLRSCYALKRIPRSRIRRIRSVTKSPHFSSRGMRRPRSV